MPRPPRIEFDVPAKDLRRRGCHAGPAKLVALELSCRLSGRNQRQIGEYFGNISSMAVCMARRRLLEPRPAADGRLSDIVERLQRTLLLGAQK